MLNFNIKNKFNNLSIKDKLLLYIIPLLIFINIIYIINNFLIQQKSFVKKQIYLDMPKTKYSKKKIISTLQLEQLAKNIIILNLSNKDGIIQLKAQSSYKDMLKFIFQLQKLNTNIISLDINNDSKINFNIIINNKDI